MAKTVYFIRHGETENNKLKIYQGRDEVLSEKGHADAKVIAERLSHVSVDIVVSSPLPRAQQTAEHISETTNAPVVVCEVAHERQIPKALVGKAKDSPESHEFKAKRHELLRQTDNLPEGFENYEMLKTRIEGVVSFIEDRSEENVVLVSHDSFMRMIMTYVILGKQHDLDTTLTISKHLAILANGGVTTFMVEEGEWELKIYNDHAHFAE